METVEVIESEENSFTVGFTALPTFFGSNSVPMITINVFSRKKSVIVSKLMFEKTVEIEGRITSLNDAVARDIEVANGSRGRNLETEMSPRWYHVKFDIKATYRGNGPSSGLVDVPHGEIRVFMCGNDITTDALDEVDSRGETDVDLGPLGILLAFLLLLLAFGIVSHKNSLILDPKSNIYNDLKSKVREGVRRRH